MPDLNSAHAAPLHRRLVFDRGPGETPDYANLYRFGQPAGPAPLLVYVGGAITKQQHAQRFHTEPTPILNEVVAALERTGTERLDVLLAPSPPRGDEPGMTLLESFARHFEEQLLPALEGPPPLAVAFVGYSFGAHLATYLALGREAARALVTIGGAGIAEAAQAARPAAARDLQIALFHNEDDPLPRPERAIWAFEERLQPRLMPVRPGDHPFQFYAANESIVDAFALALEWLAG